MKYKEEYELSKLDIKPNNIVIMKYDIEKFDLLKVQDVFIQLKNAIYPISIIAIPKGIELEVTEKEDLLNYLKSI